jgi:hypothetical protein
MPSQRSSWSQWLYGLCAAGLALFAAVPGHAHMATFDEARMIGTSTHIVVATVASAEPRWNDRHNLIVTDYVLMVEDRLRGAAPARLKITIAGGTLDGETQQTSVSTPLETGSRYLLFLGDLQQPVFNPVTGGWQGVIREVRGEDGLAYAAAGESGVILRSAGQDVQFAHFVEALRVRIEKLAGAPVPDGPRRSTAEERATLPVKDFDPAAAHGRPAESAVPRPEQRPEPPPPLLPAVEMGAAQEDPDTADLPRSILDAYRYEHAAGRYVQFNQLPHSFSVSPHDEYMMATWNKYADLFRVYAQPTGTWAWANGVFDLAGFPSNAQMTSQFGQTWSAGTLGITFYRWTSGPIVEADIALNPAYSWTVDERLATRPGNPNSFRHTMLHELGHSWGLHHPWETQNVWWDSVMNYAPTEFRLATLQADDTTAIRTAYPGISIHDVIVSGYRTKDDPASNHARYYAAKPTPTSLKAGKSFSLTNSIKVENGGTDNIVNPAIEIYLVPQRMTWVGSLYLKTVRYTTTIRPYTTAYLNLGSIRVPTNIPGGTYFIGYFVRDSRDGFQNNNSAWSDWNGTVRVTR